MKEHLWLIVSNLFGEYQMKIWTKEVPDDLHIQSDKYGYTPYLLFTWEE